MNEQPGQHITLFHRRARPEQQDAIAQMLAHGQGILRPDAFGKTVVGAYMIGRDLNADSRAPVVNYGPMRERLTAFLDLPVGYSSGERTRDGEIDVAVIQSYSGKVSRRLVGLRSRHLDECHHLSAFTFERILRQVKANMLMTATADSKEDTIL